MEALPADCTERPKASIRKRKRAGQGGAKGSRHTQKDGLVTSGYANFLTKYLIDGPPCCDAKQRAPKQLDIMLDCPVTQVIHTDKGCTVVLKGGKRIECDLAVITLPLGVLQASISQNLADPAPAMTTERQVGESTAAKSDDAAALLEGFAQVASVACKHTNTCTDDGPIRFQPPLSHRKQLAIERLGFGTENKVLIRYKTKFWPEDPFFQCTDSRFRFLNLDYYGKLQVVVAHIAPPFSIGFNGMSDKEVVTLTARTFGAMFGHADPEVIASTVTHWERDSFARGSYSYAKIGSDVEEECNALGAPQGRLFFAGEACNSSNMQCVNGAFISGQEAAYEIMDALDNDFA